MFDVTRFESVRIRHRKGALFLFAAVIGAFALAAKAGVWLHGKFLDQGASAGALEATAAAVLDYPAHLPPVLAGCLYAAALFLPGIVIILASDQTATDLRERHAPFILARVSATDFFFGRLLGATLIWAAVVGVSSVVAALVMVWESHTIGILETITGVAHIALVLTLYGLPYIALMSLGNVVTQSPMGSMVGIFCLLIAVTWITAASESVGPWLQYADMLYPSHWRPMLLSGDVPTFARGASGALVYTAVVAGIGAWRLERIHV